MSLDSVIVNPGRLRILTALVNEPRQEFVQLRRLTQMTDGNLATHARRLHAAGMLHIDKQFRAGKPVTTFTLTAHGRDALEAHVSRLVSVLTPAAAPATDAVAPENIASNIHAREYQEIEEAWID